MPATERAIEQLAAFGDDTPEVRLRSLGETVLDLVPTSALSVWFVEEDLTLTMADRAYLAAPYPMRSSIALHVVAYFRLTSIVTVYSSRPQAFTSRVPRIERAVGAARATSVLDEDLEFRSERDAGRAPDAIRATQTVDMAVGCLMGDGLDLDEADGWLVLNAELAGVTTVAMARRVLAQVARGVGSSHPPPGR